MNPAVDSLLAATSPDVYRVRTKALVATSAHRAQSITPVANFTRPTSIHQIICAVKPLPV